MAWLSGIWISGIVQIYSLAEAVVAASADKLVPHMWKWWYSS